MTFLNGSAAVHSAARVRRSVRLQAVPTRRVVRRSSRPPPDDRPAVASQNVWRDRMSALLRNGPNREDRTSKCSSARSRPPVLQNWRATYMLLRQRLQLGEVALAISTFSDAGQGRALNRDIQAPANPESTSPVRNTLPTHAAWNVNETVELNGGEPAGSPCMCRTRTELGECGATSNPSSWSRVDLPRKRLPAPAGGHRAKRERPCVQKFPARRRCEAAGVSLPESAPDHSSLRRGERSAESAHPGKEKACDQAIRVVTKSCHFLNAQIGRMRKPAEILENCEES